MSVRRTQTRSSWIPLDENCFHLKQLKFWVLPDVNGVFVITWYWTGGLRHAPRLKEFPSRLYHLWLVGDDWGNWRLIIGGRVADLVLGLLESTRWLNELSSDFDRFVSFGLTSIDGGEFSSCRVLMIAPLRGAFSPDLDFGRGGLIEILDAGGEESNKEKRRNIFVLNFHFSVRWFKIIELIGYLVFTI